MGLDYSSAQLPAQETLGMDQSLAHAAPPAGRDLPPGRRIVVDGQELEVTLRPGPRCHHARSAGRDHPNMTHADVAELDATLAALVGMHRLPRERRRGPFGCYGYVS